MSTYRVVYDFVLMVNAPDRMLVYKDDIISLSDEIARIHVEAGRLVKVS